MGLFQPDAPWARTAAAVQVVQLVPATVMSGEEADLRRIFANLRQRGIALGVEFGLLYGQGPGGCEAGIEGHSARGTALVMARRIQRLGGDLRYVAMDEPALWGHEFAGRGACRFSLQEVASRVAEGVRMVRTVFPEVQVGDTEPVGADNPAWLATLRQWPLAYSAATRTPLAFMHLDMQWRDDWRTMLAEVRQSLRSQGIPAGVIVNGIGRTDREWADAALDHYRQVEDDPTLRPDQIIVQSWEEHPTRVLPETMPGTLTNIALRIVSGRQAVGQ